MNHLPHDGPNTLLAPEPSLFVVWHKAPGKHKRWKKVGAAPTHAGAVRLVSGAGDWHIAPLHDAALAPGSLFADEFAEETPARS